jgi:WD40 repeat protein
VIAVFWGHTDGVYCTAFSPDGRRVVTASDDRTARIWDLVTGQTILVLKGHEERVRCATFSPDGSRVATAAFDGTVRVWDVSASTQALIARCLTREQRENAFLHPEPLNGVSRWINGHITRRIGKSGCASSAQMRNRRFLIPQNGSGGLLHISDRERITSISVSDRFVAEGVDDGLLRGWHDFFS